MKAALKKGVDVRNLGPLNEQTRENIEKWGRIVDMEETVRKDC